MGQCLQASASRRRVCAIVLVLGSVAQSAFAAAPPAAPLGLPRATLVLGGSAPPQPGSASRALLIDAATLAVRTNARRLGVDPLDTLTPDSATLGRHGPAVVTFRQRRGQLPVHGARIAAALDGAGNVRALTGGFSPDIATSGRTTFKLDAPAAIRALLRTSGIAPDAALLQALPARNGYQYYAFESAGFAPARPVRIRAEYFPAVGRLVAAYYVEILGRRKGRESVEGWGGVVSAEDGTLLRMEPLVQELAHAYRVYADAAGAPYADAYGNTLPHPTALRDGWLPGTAAPMSLVALDHAGLSTADPWLPAGATHTVGNNVDAFFNGGIAAGGTWTGDGFGPAFAAAEGDFRAPLTSAAAFDYRYDPSLALSDYLQRPGAPATPVPTASAQLNAKIVQGFYAANWLHDQFYDLGFDEESGNAQHDNFGRGGLAGDRLVVNAGFAATFAFTPADGDSPQLALGRNSTSRSGRDASGFDFPVVAHEWAHVLFGRLAGAGTGPQRGALNEGTADLVAALLTIRESHRLAAPGRTNFGGLYAIGAYVNRDYDFPLDALPPAGTAGVPDDTYHHGVRRYPITADLALNPLTLRHVDYDNPVPAGSAPFDWKYRAAVNSEVHSAGEVWASAVWQCARNVLADESRFPFEQRRRRMLAYVVAGLKLLPADPDFVTARNALLFAVRAADAADYESCRRGFAARGFGAGAVAPRVTEPANRGAVESFATADAALGFPVATLVETGGDGDGVLDVGEIGRLAVTVRNTGLVPLDRVRVHVPPLAGAYAFPAGSTASGIALQPNEERTVSFPVSILSTLGAQVLLFNLAATDDLRPDAYGQRDGLFTVNYDLRRDAYTDSLVSDAGFVADWTTGFETAHGCTVECFGELTNWRRVTHLGVPAYRIGSDNVSLDAHLTTVAFRVSATAPLRITILHDYALSRTSRTGSPAAGVVEISVGGGTWQSIAPFAIAGTARHTGTSAGWRTDTVDLGTAFAGQTVRLRWRAIAADSWVARPVHWALGRVSIEGAVSAPFSTMYVDVT